MVKWNKEKSVAKAKFTKNNDGCLSKMHWICLGNGQNKIAKWLPNYYAFNLFKYAILWLVMKSVIFL
jgi:hypothetical protein